MEKKLEKELEAYLERELTVQPAPEVKPSPGAEKPAERLQGVLALAAAEEQWLRTLPAPEATAENSEDLGSGECLLPEHLRPKPAPEAVLAPPVAPLPSEVPWPPAPAPLPGLAVVPQYAQPGWSPPVVPVAAAVASRTPWIVVGALMGVSAASLLVAGMLWHDRARLPDKAPVVAAPVPAGSGSPVPPAPAASAPEHALFVKDSPLAPPREPLPGGWKTAAADSERAVPGPAVPAPVTAPEPGAIAHAAQESLRPPQATGAPVPVVTRGAEPTVPSAKAEIVKPRETPRPTRTAAAQERRDIEDPALKETEEETPAPKRAPAAVAKAESKPAAEPESGEFDELDKDFAREMGFTKDAPKKVPESKGVKSVWIPPDPAQDLPESLTAEDVKKVVFTNQPAITSCIRRHKEDVAGLSGGRFIMRWSVYPTGSTFGASMETQELRGTALASCIEDLVKDWKFPRHKAQMGPIRFPFVF